jgi:hypothetical protein
MRLFTTSVPTSVSTSLPTSVPLMENTFSSSFPSHPEENYSEGQLADILHTLIGFIWKIVDDDYGKVFLKKFGKQIEVCFFLFFLQNFKPNKEIMKEWRTCHLSSCLCCINEIISNTNPNYI